ncbi:F-box protein CPR1-like [Cicer arietinum]|uniref:F-box/kelch-repeat protein At3g06240-like n=1 Tax=Cicer arietinum TaxID=3827 RepID=A0A1S2XM03_CICAR|nr:F-box/kelch-repeat protein At3g06240-like [Cicer arietinum]
MQSQMKKILGVTNGKGSNHVHDDIAFSILSKLPFKSLKRFQCVRKSWSHLFDNPGFMSVYGINFLSNCPNDNHISVLLWESGNQWYSLSGERFENRVMLDWPNLYPDQFNFLKFFSFCSINAILCYESNYFSKLIMDRKIILWNTTTKEMKVIPSSPFELFSPPVELNIKANVKHFARYDLHGFGYDRVTDDYKLIRRTYIQPFFTDYPNLKHYGHDNRDDPFDSDLSLLQDKFLDSFWEVYSLRSNSWKKLNVDMPNCVRGCSSSFYVYLDGVCHWLHIPHRDKYIGACLISFDLSNEVFIITPIPTIVKAQWPQLPKMMWLNKPELGVLNESMAMISYDKTMTFHIFVLGEVGVKESWIKLFTVGPLTSVKTLIGMGKKGEIFFRNKDCEIAWFDLNTKTVEVLGFKGQRFKPKDKILIYSESLLSMKRIQK